MASSESLDENAGLVYTVSPWRELSRGHRVRGEGLGPVREVAFMSCILDVEKRVRCNVFKANANYVFESNKKAKTCKLSLNKFGIRGA
ncbi:hypothetical protein BHE74_00020817 [Ensete ventricosum]|nr:hypothetical protein BHE74_00020817 [Ensete ventricosum]RZR85679.1 hypothetical protein BHM03_00012693 [Ensete ventricosum]